jgi:hypothetical protein
VEQRWLTPSLAITNADTIRGDRGQAGVSKGFGRERASSLGRFTGTHDLLPILNWAIRPLGALVVAASQYSRSRSARLSVCPWLLRRRRGRIRTPEWAFSACAQPSPFCDETCARRAMQVCFTLVAEPSAW